MPYPATEYAQAFIKHRQPLLALLEQIPSEHGDFTIRADALSFHTMLDHLSQTDGYLLDVLAGRKFIPAAASPDFSSALLQLKSSTLKVQQLLENLTEVQLSQEIKAFGQTWKAYRLIDFGREHEAHHKGQLWMMARAVGIEPPMFYQF